MSHERSGTHLLINTIAHCFGYSWEQIDLDLAQGFDPTNPAMIQRWTASHRGISQRRIFKSHHTWPALQAIEPLLRDEFRVFLITRDGRDVMTSFWTYLNRLAPGWGPRASSVGTFMRTRPCGGIMQYQHRPSITMLQRWIDHMASWRDAPLPACHVSYEELTGSFTLTLDRIAHWLRQPVIDGSPPPADAPSSLPWRKCSGTWMEFLTNQDLEYFHAQCQCLETT